MQQPGQTGNERSRACIVATDKCGQRHPFVGGADRHDKFDGMSGKANPWIEGVPRAAPPPALDRMLQSSRTRFSAELLPSPPGGSSYCTRCLSVSRCVEGRMGKVWVR